ncbi:penicillin-binding transpeptidase domain-containing protein [Pseudoflavonifractor sp. MSJ-37]|uniref:penicillin-binding transpeptidase domain-containing protein n=1 Tax=Pseudoflavonifractor sp. MSJ-37 TaxID=2841531 RepID=UPI001C0FB2A4|nr:penicillin-binding transpeptidase domain-containing protein [Pseudoflavonifractor sp. MSJ-37]MBU5434338.1 penicillin-binding protein [Pseudoflavonifractor sp. MSJ-37]
MKKIEKRAVMCLLLALILLAGLALFCVRFALDGGRWAGFAANRHLYNSQGQLAVGRVLDRDGDVLSWPGEDGSRHYYDNATVRKATLHAVGDRSGNIGTGALTAFADKLSGYNLLTGAYSPLGEGNDLYLTLDARYNYIAYEALGGKKGTVGVYDYTNGQILCMVSAPTFDPADPPNIQEGDDRYDGVYLNRFLSGTFIPGSIFKTVTLAAAIEHIPDLFQRRFTCTGSTDVGGEPIACPRAHGDMDIYGALANSCNGVFGQLAAELGADTLNEYVDKAGLTGSYKVSGIPTAKGSFDTGSTENQLGWAGVGQYNDLVDPCSMMVWMGAIANGGKAAVPQLILKTETPLGIPGSFYRKHQTKTLVEEDTARTLADMMANNVSQTYGSGRFPNMDLCAKSGTGEVGGGKAPNTWFAGFLRNADAPYAFVVLVEEGSNGSDTAGAVASKVLDAIVNGY